MQQEFSSSGKTFLTFKNKNKSSLESEALSLEMLHCCFGATLMETEKEISYKCSEGPEVDYTCSINNITLGVSVTRVMRTFFTYNKNVQEFMEKKLNALQYAKENSVKKWDINVLHVWAESPRLVKLVNDAWDNIDQHLISNTILIVTLVIAVKKEHCCMFNNHKKRTAPKTGRWRRWRLIEIIIVIIHFFSDLIFGLYYILYSFLQFYTLL